MSVSTPLMGLIQPTINVDSGLAWEQSINANSSVIDQHNHTPGSGSQIPPSGININGPFTFNNNPAIDLQSAVFHSQTSLSTLLAVYTIGNDLYFNDGASNVIRITSGGSVNATSSGISSGSATASFVTGVLVVNSASNTPANIQCGSVLLGNNVAASKFLTLAPPAAMASNYGLTLPTLPGATAFLTLDTSGNISGTNPINQGILRTNLAPVGQQISATCNQFGTGNTTTYQDVTNLAVSITTTGRPVWIGLIPDGSTNLSEIQAAGASAKFAITRDGSIIGVFGLGANTITPAGCIQMLDVPSSGTYLYKVQAALTTAGTGAAVQYVKLCAYEL